MIPGKAINKATVRTSIATKGIIPLKNLLQWDIRGHAANDVTV